MGPEEMKTIAGWIVKILSNIGDPGIRKQVSEEVQQMCLRFPVPGIDY
jgi:glycine hydroxymethyltransferase